MSVQNPRLSVLNNRKIDGYGLRVAQIDPEVTYNLTMDICLHLGALVRVIHSSSYKTTENSCLPPLPCEKFISLGEYITERKLF